MKPGGETERLSAERQANKEKMDKAMADAALRRQAREAEAAAGAKPAESVADPAPPPSDPKPE